MLRILVLAMCLSASVAIAQELHPPNGTIVTDDTLAAGVMQVHVTGDGDKALAGVTVKVVGYAADRKVRVVTAKTDTKGIARFKGLDTSGSVAHFVLAQAPSKAGAHRLITKPIVFAGVGGVHAYLVAAGTKPVEGLDDLQSAGPAVAKAKVRVAVEGVAPAGTPVEIFDAASAKVIAKAVAADKEAIIAVPVKSGQLLYAEAIFKQERYRSLPFEMVADRGATAVTYVYPRMLPIIDFRGYADDAALAGGMSVRLTNNSWIPYAASSRSLIVPLPDGATNIELYEAPEYVSVSAGALEVKRALPPGEIRVLVDFELPAVKGEVAYSHDLPYGVFDGSLHVENEPGISLDKLPASTKVDTQTTPRGEYLVVEKISITPNQSMQLVVKLPKPGPANALRHACRRLAPDPSPLVGKPINFALTTVEGKQVKSASYRGKSLLVNVMATWDSLSGKERPTLAELTKQEKGVSVVMIASDRDPKEVTKTVGKLPFPVALDPPATAGDNIGAYTTSLGIKLLPESILVDRKGIVRYHFQNARTWDSPEALRCVKAFVAAP